MNHLSFKTADELQAFLGERIRRLRIQRALDQASVADKAGVSLRAVRNLEAGRGSTMATFLSVLKALDAVEWLDVLVPEISVSPMSLLRHSSGRQRVRRSSLRYGGKA
jgi:transcriptional regulator with XRE-family HTH domain